MQYYNYNPYVPQYQYSYNQENYEDEEDDYDYQPIVTTSFNKKIIPIVVQPVLIEKTPVPVITAPWANVKYPTVSLREQLRPIVEQPVEKKIVQNLVDTTHNHSTKHKRLIKPVDEYHPLLINTETAIWNKERRVSTGNILQPQPQKQSKMTYMDLNRRRSSVPVVKHVVVVEQPGNERSKQPDSVNNFVKKIFCKNVINNKKCHDKCKFAHNIGELSPDTCFKSCNDQKCKYLHNNETIELFYNRVYNNHVN